MKRTTKTIRLAKGNSQVVCVTAYDAVTARLATAADVDLILVGDSVGNVVLGFDSTVPVTLDMMAHHTAAVARAKPSALVVADIPFGVAHWDFQDLLKACVRLMQECGAEAVKIEGGRAAAPTIARLSAAGVPVMGHIGLQPQQVFRLGGYRKFGKLDEAAEIVEDALAVEAAGAFAIVGEMLTPEVAKTIKGKISVPLIGIGSGDDCDGRILVMHDILGFSPSYPSFAKPLANMAQIATDALVAYRDSVRALHKNQ